MALEIQHVWEIDCWRCANTAVTDGSVSDDEARDQFKQMGWTQQEDGFQMCPQCSGAK